MVQDFLRRVTGYNFPFVSSWICCQVVGTVYNYDCATGPGEFEGWVAYKWGGADADLFLTTVTLVVDGTIMFAQPFQNWLGINPASTQHNHFATCDHFSAAELICSWKFKVPYESTCTLRAVNNGANPLDLAFFPYHKCYR